MHFDANNVSKATLISTFDASKNKFKTNNRLGYVK